MRKDIHPEYKEVLFHDTNADVYFLTRSTVATKTTREYEGQEYPYFPLDISSASHHSTLASNVKHLTKVVLLASTSVLVHSQAVAKKPNLSTKSNKAFDENRPVWTVFLLSITMSWAIFEQFLSKEH